jgi:hypothetical protein
MFSSISPNSINFFIADHICRESINICIPNADQVRVLFIRYQTKVIVWMDTHIVALLVPASAELPALSVGALVVLL